MPFFGGGGGIRQLNWLACRKIHYFTLYLSKAEEDTGLKLNTAVRDRLKVKLIK